MANYYVDGQAINDTGTGLSPESPKKKPSSVLALVAPGDSVFIKGGQIYRCPTAGSYPIDISAVGVASGTESSPINIYFDWTGISNNRNFNKDWQAKIYSSVRVSNTTHSWNQSLTVGLKYLTLTGGANPNIGTVKGVWKNTEGDLYSSVTKGVMPSLLNGQWDYVTAGSGPDGLVFNTVYIRDDGGVITTLDLEMTQANAVIALSKNYYVLNGGLYRFGGIYNIYIMSSSNTPKLVRTTTQYAVQHGVQSYANMTYHYNCVSSRNILKGFQLHSDSGTVSPDLHAYYYNCLSTLNGYYGFVVYGKGHYRNCISAFNTMYQHYKQVPDPTRVIDPDEQNCLWFGGLYTFYAIGYGTNGETLYTKHPSSLAEDPLLASAPSDNYHLQPTSPCLNAGTLIAGILTDLDGNQYPSPNGASIGPYEDYPLPATGMGPWSHFNGTMPTLALAGTSPANGLEFKVEITA